MMNATLRGKPDAGNPHVRFDEGEVAPAKPRRGSLLYKAILTFGVLALAFAAHAISIIKPSVGDIPVYGKEDDTWRGQVIFNDAPHPPETFRECGQDFFEHEYGAPLDFAQGDTRTATEAVTVGTAVWRDGALEILSGGNGRQCSAGAGTPPPQKAGAKNGAGAFSPPQGFGLFFGRTSASPTADGVKIGDYNGQSLSQWEFVALDLEQSAPTSVWRFAFYNGEGKMIGRGSRWTVSGTGRRRVVRQAFNDRGALDGARVGIGLECLTPASGVKLRSVRISPRGGDVFYRKEFTLDFVPDVAKLSFMVHSLDDYDLFVNGVNLAKPTGQLTSIQPRDMEIAKYLRQGVNVVALRTRYTVLSSYPCGPEPRSRLVLDLFAFDRTGRSAFVGSGTDWRTTFETPAAEWVRPGFDTSKWRTPAKGSIWTRTTAGESVPVGFNPQHIGFLTTRPAGTKYPIFAADSQAPRRFAASYPVGLRNAALAVRFARADTGVAAEVAEVKRDEKDGFVRVGYELKGERPGPYFLTWTLKADGVCETNEDEVVFVGRVAQDMLSPATFEREFRKRLELVQTIDPVKEHTLGDRFMTADCDIRGGHRDVTVVTTNGYSYLTYVTKMHNSVMTWRLDTPEIGAAYWLEVDIPDDRERTIQAGVVHSVGANYDNCPMPSGSTTMTDCSGAITTGGVQPLSGGLKTLTMAFYAANRISSVLFTETWLARNPTAIAAIRLYRVRGGFPGLAIPKTDRRIFEHHERFTTWQTYASCSESVERGGFHPHIYHRHAWKNWYEAIEKRIRMLRFKGHNAAVEGIFMYDHAICPDADCINTAYDGARFDVPYLLSWMYDANGIDCYFGWEQNRTNSSRRDGIDRGVSDRKIRRGLDRGIYIVRTNGTQRVCYAASGVNMFAKGVREDSFSSIRRVYDRYERYGHVKGFFLAYGFWWVPCFPQMVEYSSEEYGFDDDSMDAFTRATGIRFDVRPDDPDRFEKRCRTVYAKHRDRYLAWRASAYRDWFRELNGVLSSGKNAWPILLSPNFSHSPSDRKLPFLRADATEEEKANHLRGRLDREGWPTTFGSLPGVKNYFAPIGFNQDWKWGVPTYQRAWSAYLRNDGTQKVIAEMGSYYASFQLAEHHLRFRFDDLPWYWGGVGALCAQQRPAGAAAYVHELEGCKEQTPKAIVVAGIDCNPYNGQSEECRRFAAGYYAMPEGPMRPVSRVTGIDARALPGGYLRLYNLSDKVLTGELSCSAPFRSAQVEGLGGTSHALTVPPYALIVLKSDDASPAWHGSFR